MNRRKLAKLLVQGALGTAAHPLLAKVLPSSSQPRFSVMLWTLAKQATFDQSLEIVAQAGYQGIELVGEFHNWSPAQTQQTLSRLRSLKLTIDAASGVKAGFAVPDQTSAFLTQFTAHLNALETLGCPQAILLSGPTAPNIRPAAQLQTATDNLKQAADLAAKRNIEVLIEPIDPLEQPNVWLQSVAQAFPLARAVNHPNLKVLYDLYHQQRACGNLIEKLEPNLDLIGLIHAADVPGRHEPGTGEIDFPVIYRKLAQLHYSRWIAMEFYPTQDPTATLRTARLAAQAAFHA